MRFIDGAVSNGINKEVAASIFLKIEPFAEYGFNKSHAAAYAIIAYQTAYLKAYFPYEFFSASMTMDISSQNKLSEFYEELKRLKINIIRPNINLSYASFKSDKKNFYYALGAIKNVGYEAISNIINEREKNGEFNSFFDFINRVNPKDINKLQLEGLIKGGAFDCLNANRKSIIDSVPNLILKSKNIHENKATNQIDLFSSETIEKDELINNSEDWNFEDRLAKEFEAIGFFISDHPLNQFKDVFEEYKIVNFNKFSQDPDTSETNIAATLLKIQEKKTQKGNSYAIIKLTDLSSVFELFIFSDILEFNREVLKEGNSLLLTISKNLSDEENRFKRINVKKISSLKNLFNQPIFNVEIFLKNSNAIEKVEKILSKNGETQVKINILDKKDNFIFNLKNKRFVDRKNLNLLKNQGISANIL